MIALPLTEEVVRELMEVVSSETERAPMAAWALGFGEIPADLRSDTVRLLLEVAADPGRPDVVREHATEAIAERLRFSDPIDRDRQAAEAGMIGLMKDTSRGVRFWSAFGLGQLRTAAAVPLLRKLTMDETSIPGWWTVGEEANDAIDVIEGREPPERGVALQ